MKDQNLIGERVHLLGNQDPSQDPNIQAILDASAHGRRTVLNLKWNYHTLPFPEPGAPAMTEELDRLNRLLPDVMGKVDILVIGNEPFIETKPSQSGQSLVVFYETMADIDMHRSPAEPKAPARTSEYPLSPAFQGRNLIDP